MPVYCVNYDLKGEEGDYKELFKVLKKFPPYCHALKSCWFITATVGPAELMKTIKFTLKPGDKVVIVQVQDKTEWATTANTTGARTFLSANVKKAPPPPSPTNRPADRLRSRLKPPEL